jgi:hypothetical protein
VLGRGWQALGRRVAQPGAWAAAARGALGSSASSSYEEDDDF